MMAIPERSHRSKVADRAPPDVGDRHRTRGRSKDLLNDVDREVVMADIQGWIDARIGAVRSGLAIGGADAEARTVARV